MASAVLIVTHRSGFEADPVIDELKNRGIEVFRFNTDSGDHSSIASFTSETGLIELSCDGRCVTSKDISVGWCQQLPPYLGQAGGERECLQRENLLALQLSAFDLLPIPWLNKPSCVLYASNKVSQLVVARSVGFAVPKTLISNDPIAIREFARKQAVVAKNLATPWIVRSHNETRAAYTRIVDPAWLCDDAALSFAPVIYQEYHERRRDIRVVVIGDTTFSASCEPGPHQREDVRKESGAGESYRACKISEEMRGKLFAAMRDLNIEYCAADFMEDNHGNMFFLEVNTCGAWWWLDQLYDGAICRALASALQLRMGGSV